MQYMKFFTREWHSGALSDEHAEAVALAYETHVRTLAPALPDDLSRLTTISLHDGLIEQVVANTTAGTLTCTLRIGNLQIGYSTLELAYAGVLLPGRDSSMFRELVRTGAEILSDELDVSTEGYVHRLYFSTADEIAIVFETLALTQVRRTDRSISIPIGERFRLIEG
ncbi:MAG: hypothetical protein JWN70_6592 [Planctomycetaceae bacterium]|nr:hypothetical protein [Planctomycetaceae bacterium]